MAAEITAERVAAAAARLHDGEWWYSARQLYYAVCADVETAPTRVASGEVGLGVLLILIGALTGQRILLTVLGAVGLLVLVVGIVTHLQERRPQPMSRLLAISQPEFQRQFIDGRTYPGLLASPEPIDAPTGETLVVCDRLETAAVVAANRARIGDVGVVVATGTSDHAAGGALIALHDCDPAGCAMVADLRDRGAGVIDAGINPAELAGHRLQVIEGAPARLPRDLSRHLDESQLDWLRSGRRLECATETPQQLAERVQGALAAQRPG